MARTKDRHIRKAEHQDTVSTLKIWRAAFYGRISSDRNGEKRDSIETQRLLAFQYAADKEDIEIVETYIDDGVSGTKFERDSFSRLLEDVKTRKINCIIVKDLSRFGRNLTEVSNYLEKVFPFMGVRFIALTDGYDSMDERCDSQMLAVMIKNLVNDMYAKDASKKMADNMEMRMKRGDYCGGDAPYGYKRVKNAEGLSITVPDKITAPYVKMIFEQFVSGDSYMKITKWLNDNKLSAPRDYARTGLLFREEGNNQYWGYSTVKRILENPHYLGINITRKTRTSLLSGEKNVLLPEEEWIVKKDAHEALVSEELFCKAKEITEKKKQDTMIKRDTSKYKLIGKSNFKYDGILMCGKCGKRMSRQYRRKENGDVLFYHYYYICSTYREVSRQMCTANRWTEEVLDELVYRAVKQQITLAEDALKKLKQFNNRFYDMYLQMLEAEQSKVISIIKRNERMRLETYEKFAIGELDQKQYEQEVQRIKTVKQEMESRNMEIQDETKSIKRLEKTNYKWLADLVKKKEVSYLTREVVRSFISKIKVYDDKRIEITFLFQDQIAELMQRLEKGESICKGA